MQGPSEANRMLEPKRTRAIDLSVFFDPTTGNMDQSLVWVFACVACAVLSARWLCSLFCLVCSVPGRIVYFQAQEGCDPGTLDSLAL